MEEKQLYIKPLVLDHQKIAFETLISCNPPSRPGEITGGRIPICVHEDGTWTYR